MGRGEGGGVNPTPTDLPSSEEEMRDPFLEDLPSSAEDAIEMEEIRRNKRERDEVDRGRRKRRREEEHRGYKRKGEEPEKRQLRTRIPVTYEELNPEWDELEVWDQEGTVQNEKYSRIGQLRTGDKEEGEGERGEGLYRTKPPLVHEVISPLLAHLENVERLRNSRDEEFLRTKSSDNSLSRRSSTTRIPGVRNNRKCNQLNTMWRANMWLILMLLSWLTGAVMSTNPVPTYTVLECELEFTASQLQSWDDYYSFPHFSESVHARTMME